jgi:predicted MarR family transcription regulator
MNLKKILVFLLIISTLLSCQKKVECVTELKFDKSLWLKNQQRDCYRDREKMLYDLLDNHKIKGLKYTEIEKLLGNQEIVSTSHSKYITYTVTTKQDSTIEQKYSKELIIFLDRDSIAQSYMIAKSDK